MIVEVHTGMESVSMGQRCSFWDPHLCVGMLLQRRMALVKDHERNLKTQKA
jgi:hypothetical protein